jgi:hypothetical protein
MAGVLVVLVIVAMMLGNSGGTVSGTPTPTPAVYLWEGTEPVSGIDIVSGTNKVTLVKDATLGSWRLTAPVEEPADLFQVSGVADFFQKPQAQFTVTNTGNLEEFGLGTGAMSVTYTFSDTQGTKRTLLIGSGTPDLSGYYVKMPDSDNLYTLASINVEPMRSWLEVPPVAQPTATPFPATLVPSASGTVTGTEGITGTTTVTGTTPAGIVAPEGLATTTVTGSESITNTSPGAANPTTPQAEGSTPTP